MKAGSASDFLRCERGASAVEFAIILVPLVVIVFGSMEFGRLMWTRVALQETALAAARCMGVKQPACAPSGAYSASNTVTYVQAEASNWSVTVPTGNVTVDRGATCQGVTGFSQVTISYTFQTAVPALLGSLHDGVALQAAACFPNQS